MRRIKYFSAEDARRLVAGEVSEVVVSDDGSTDGTREILMAYQNKDARVRMIDGPKKGVKANVENALRACEGAYIFLADQDDIWMEDKLKTAIDKIAEFSSEAVISLSLWGEATLHPQFEKFIEKVLSYSGLSVLIELSQLNLSDEKLSEIDTTEPSLVFDISRHAINSYLENNNNRPKKIVELTKETRFEDNLVSSNFVSGKSYTANTCEGVDNWLIRSISTRFTTIGLAPGNDFPCCSIHAVVAKRYRQWKFCHVSHTHFVPSATKHPSSRRLRALPRDATILRRLFVSSVIFHIIMGDFSSLTDLFNKQS